MKAVYKTHRVGIKESNRKIMSVLIVIFLVAFMLQFELIQKLIKSVAPELPIEKVADYASNIGWMSLGVLLIYAGSVTSVIPFIGAGFAVVGALIVIIQAIRLYNMSDKGKITGLGYFGNSSNK